MMVVPRAFASFLLLFQFAVTTYAVGRALYRSDNGINNIVQNLTLVLSNSSPSVLDSAVVFQAWLRDFQGRNLEDSRYEYIWEDSIKSKKITFGGFYSSITRVYRADQVKEGNYSMMVTVKKDSMRVAVAVTDICLTASLNGNMTVGQDLAYHRKPEVLSTHIPIVLKTQLTDIFPSSAKHLHYSWYMGHDLIGISDTPQLELALGKPGPANLTVIVKAKVATEVFILPRYLNKTGQFSQSVILKDPLSNIEIEGGAAVAIHELFYLNITCSGSGPTSLCWDVSPMSGGSVNSTCTPTVFQDGCNHKVALRLGTGGKYHFRAVLTNDVSQMEKHWYLFVYDPGSVNVPAITVPVVFACLSIFIIVFGAAYIIRLRKRPFVEVADFDFHPSLTRAAESSRLTVRVKKTVRSIFQPVSTYPNIPRPVKSTFRDYGSVEEDLTL